MPDLGIPKIIPSLITFWYNLGNSKIYIEFSLFGGAWEKRSAWGVDRYSQGLAARAGRPLPRGVGSEMAHGSL